ncbi:MAG TPA: Rne/Rng family ribonuclease [Polyangia bacterium]|jgi:ribonuclease G|nr:Rne/Rng family ribonuclease [Polyangia bacterium]
MPNSLLVINADGPETRVALVEDGFLGELYIERKRERGIAGNIYKGRVERVLPGMQAAFVNIGLEKSAYLHVSDVRGTPDDLTRLFSSESSRAEDEDEDAADAARAHGGARIEDLLKEGQEIVVQVTKEPISTKGARTTRYISLPGRHLVFMPTVDHVGISRRIGSDRERKRLREIVDSMRPPGSGFIVRTVADGVSERELRADMEFLIKLWNEVVRRAEGGRCPALIYNDLDLLLRTVRDLFTADVEKLIIDSRPEYDRVKKFIAAFMPDFSGNIELYDGTDPIFDGFGIEIEIDRALERKVWLKSGGYLIVDEMEALTAIDVNTGRFVGKSSLEDTITKTNLEASREVAEQLRIRSIGGMIVVDFIDMDRPHNREKVTRAFNEYLRKDRSKAAVTRISELGLIEMTRKRTRESLLHTLTEPCSACEGKGYTKSRRTISYELFRELRRQGDLIQGDTVLVEVHPEVAQVLATSDHAFLEDMEKRLQKRIVVKARGSFHLEDFEIRSPGDKQPLERSEAGGGGREADKGEREAKRRKRRRRGLGSPAEIEALLAEDEAASVVDPEYLAGEGSSEAASVAEPLVNGADSDAAGPAPGSGSGAAPGSGSASGSGSSDIGSSSPATAGDESLESKPPVE